MAIFIGTSVPRPLRLVRQASKPSDYAVTRRMGLERLGSRARFYRKEEEFMGSGEALMRQTPNTKSVGKEWQGRKDSNLGPSVLELLANVRSGSLPVASEYE